MSDSLVGSAPVSVTTVELSRCGWQVVDFSVLEEVVEAVLREPVCDYVGPSRRNKSASGAGTAFVGPQW